MQLVKNIPKIAGGTMKHVLVVDDDRVVNLLITRELQKNGYGVFMSYDTVQAGTTLARTRIDAVIVDCGWREAALLM
jgi:DNA-binding response OmpR family regulator